MCRFYASQTHVLVQPFESLSRVQKARTLSTTKVFLQDWHRHIFQINYQSYLFISKSFEFSQSMIDISFDGPPTIEEMSLKFRIETILVKHFLLEQGLCQTGH